MIYGNYFEGFSYSPDRSRDVDRFNPSTRQNYSTSNRYYSASDSTKNSGTQYKYFDPCERYNFKRN